MKEKILLTFLMLTLLTLAFAPLVKAAAVVKIYGYTDKTQYRPGEKVTLKFWVHNNGPDEIVLKSVAIYYPWYSPMWESNETLKDINAVLSAGKNWSDTRTFTVPTDGRAVGGDVDFEFTYTIGTTTYTDSDDISINVAGTPAYGSLQDMDKLITLFTIQAVLLIVCTIIIAATIFLARRPQVLWRKEEKVE